MDLFFDVVVLGGGPAGSSCGISLQKSGIKSCVIDRAHFPRRKVCAGLVTEKTYVLLKTLLDIPQAELDSLFYDESSEVRLYKRNSFLVSTGIDRKFRFVNRALFDHYLINHYEMLGGVLYQGEKSYSVDYDSKTLTLTSGDRIRWNHLIAADGAMSSVHSAFGVKPDKAWFAVECMVPKKDAGLSGTNIYFGYMKAGYAWAFPAGGNYCIGLGTVHEKGFPYRRELDGLLNDLGIKNDGIKYYGAFLPSGKTVDQSLFPDSVLLAGDAAGFADPITGEGLYLALLSGTEAARACASGEAKKEYLKAVAPIAERIETGNRHQKILYDKAFMSLFYRLADKRERLLRFYLDEQISQYKYSHSPISEIMKDYKKAKREG